MARGVEELFSFRDRAQDVRSPDDLRAVGSREQEVRRVHRGEAVDIRGGAEAFELLEERAQAPCLDFPVNHMKLRYNYTTLCIFIQANDALTPPLMSLVVCVWRNLQSDVVIGAGWWDPSQSGGSTRQT